MIKSSPRPPICLSRLRKKSTGCILNDITNSQNSMMIMSQTQKSHSIGNSFQFQTKQSFQFQKVKFNKTICIKPTNPQKQKKESQNFVNKQSSIFLNNIILQKENRICFLQQKIIGFQASQDKMTQQLLNAYEKIKLLSKINENLQKKNQELQIQKQQNFRNLQNQKVKTFILQERISKVQKQFQELQIMANEFYPEHQQLLESQGNLQQTQKDLINQQNQKIQTSQINDN